MNLTYLNGNAAFLLGKRFWKCSNKNLQCLPADFALEYVVPAIQDLKIESDEGLIAFAIIPVFLPRP